MKFDIPSNSREWGLVDAAMEDAAPIEARIRMSPAETQARLAQHVSFEVRPNEDFTPGSDILVLIPREWKLDLNGAFPRIYQFFAVRQGGHGNGRQCLLEAETSVPCGLRCLGKAYEHQQRQDAGQHPHYNY